MARPSTPENRISAEISCWTKFSGATALPGQTAIDQLDAGTLPENFETDVLGPFKEALAQQIARALQFFYSASSFNRTDQVILAGGAAGISHIEELVAERLGFPVSIANPFAPMGMAPGIDVQTIERAAPQMMIATGLALRAFD